MSSCTKSLSFCFFFFFLLSVRLESPTRTLTMEAPRGVEVSASKGPLKVSGRKDLQLESTEGEVRRIQMYSELKVELQPTIGFIVN